MTHVLYVFFEAHFKSELFFQNLNFLTPFCDEWRNLGFGDKPWNKDFFDEQRNEGFCDKWRNVVFVTNGLANVFVMNEGFCDKQKNTG